MRILTVAAGIMLSFEGAFCFLFSAYSFSAVAFPVGLGMLITGALIITAYLVSGRKNRLPDTVLVEGLVTAMFGFAVLNNQVSDNMLTMFFGSLTCISGATRLTQSLDVSRYKPRDWAKVMPLSIVSAVFGVIMMMPVLVSATNSLLLVGTAFIVNGLSLLVYAMYMEKRSSDERAEESRLRAEAKKAARQAKEKQRDELRKLSKEERDAAKKELRAQQKAEKAEKRAARQAERAARLAARQPASANTITFTKSESDELRRIGKELGFEDPSPEDIQGSEAPAPDSNASVSGYAAGAAEAGVISASDSGNGQLMPDAVAEAYSEDLTDSMESFSNDTDSAAQTDAGMGYDTDVLTEMSEQEIFDMMGPAWEADEDDIESTRLVRSIMASRYPSFKKPTDIPSVRARMSSDAADESPEQSRSPEILSDLSAVRLDEIEDAAVEPLFPDVELPDVELVAEGGESWKRFDIMRSIEKGKKLREELPSYTPISLDELRPVELDASDADDSRFTQRFNITWKDPFSEEEGC